MSLFMFVVFVVKIIWKVAESFFLQNFWYNASFLVQEAYILILMTNSMLLQASTNLAD